MELPFKYQYFWKTCAITTKCFFTFPLLQLFVLCLVFRLLWWTAGWRHPRWQWWAVAGVHREGRVQDVEVVLQTASCSSLWSGIGTRDASSARAATPSWASTAAPATVKEAWSSARTTTSGETWRDCHIRQRQAAGLYSWAAVTWLF